LEDERTTLFLNIGRHLASDSGSYHSAEKTPKTAGIAVVTLPSWARQRPRRADSSDTELSRTSYVLATTVWWQVRTFQTNLLPLSQTP